MAEAFDVVVIGAGAAGLMCALTAMANRTMRLQSMVQDGQLELYGEGTSLTVEYNARMVPTATARSATAR